MSYNQKTQAMNLERTQATTRKDKDRKPTAQGAREWILLRTWLHLLQHRPRELGAARLLV